MRFSFFLAAAVVVAACGGDEQGFATIEPPVSTIVPTTGPSTPVTSVDTEPMGTTSTSAARYQTGSYQTGSYQTPVVHALGEVKVYVAPTVAIETRTVPAETILGTPTVMPVLDGPTNGWVKIGLPGRPNGANGWARADQFKFARVDQSIEVDLAASTLTFYEKGEAVITTTVAIGSPTNPTPKGDFFVTDIVVLTDPRGPWGPYAIGLSARSDTITEFNGGDGIIGIHGTNRPDRIGQPVSLGCVRVPNEIIAQIATRVQLGIPVTIG